MISGFSRVAVEICVLMGYYAAYCRKFFNDVSVEPIGPTFKGQKIQKKTLFLNMGTIFSRNIRTELPLYTA